MEINDAADLYHFLFETYPGIGILVGAGIVLSLIICIIFEVKTRKLYHNHEPEEEDEWSFFDDVEDGEEEQAAKDKAEAQAKAQEGDA